METINTSAELTSATLKIQMLRDEIASDIRNGTEFKNLVPVSARKYFGPKWLDKVLGKMDSMEIFILSEKDGLKPYDLTLSGLAEAQKEYHASSHEERNNVRLFIRGIDFEGKVPVLGADKEKAVLGLAWKGSFSGTYVNAKDIEPAEKEIESLEHRMAQILAGLDTPVEEEQQIADKLPDSAAVITDAMLAAHAVRPKTIHSRALGYAMLGIGFCLTLYSVI